MQAAWSAHSATARTFSRGIWPGSSQLARICAVAFESGTRQRASASHCNRSAIMQQTLAPSLSEGARDLIKGDLIASRFARVRCGIGAPACRTDFAGSPWSGNLLSAALFSASVPGQPSLARERCDCFRHRRIRVEPQTIQHLEGGTSGQFWSRTVSCPRWSTLICWRTQGPCRSQSLQGQLWDATARSTAAAETHAQERVSFRPCWRWRGTRVVGRGGPCGPAKHLRNATAVFSRKRP